MSVQLNNFIYILNFWNFDLVGNSKVLEDFFFAIIKYYSLFLSMILLIARF